VFAADCAFGCRETRSLYRHELPILLYHRCIHSFGVRHSRASYRSCQRKTLIGFRTGLCAQPRRSQHPLRYCQARRLSTSKRPTTSPEDGISFPKRSHSSKNRFHSLHRQYDTASDSVQGPRLQAQVLEVRSQYVATARLGVQRVIAAPPSVSWDLCAPRHRRLPGLFLRRPSTGCHEGDDVRCCERGHLDWHSQ
jgi:hypothetical protein